MIFDQPVNAVEWATAFLVCGKGHDNVAIGAKAFFFILNEIRNPDGGLGFIVAGAAAIKVAILFSKLEWVEAPVFSVGFDNIDVREEENRLALVGTVEANDEVFFFGAGTAKKKVRILKTRCFQAGGGSFGNRSGGTGSEAGGDFDELFIDIAGDFFFSVRARGLGAHGCGE